MIGSSEVVDVKASFRNLSSETPRHAERAQKLFHQVFKTK